MTGKPEVIWRCGYPVRGFSPDSATLYPPTVSLTLAVAAGILLHGCFCVLFVGWRKHQKTGGVSGVSCQTEPADVEFLPRISNESSFESAQKSGPSFSGS